MKKLIYILFLLTISSFAQDQPDQGEESRIPESQREFTPEQDSAYYNALKTQLPLSLRIKEQLSLIDFMIYRRELERSNPWIAARRNLEEIPPEMLEASKNEIVQREIMIEQSQYAPFVRSRPGGIQIPMSAVMDLIGLSEDVSSKIPYELDYHAEVEIVIYSVQAVVIATLFKGVQPPGEYVRVWNGRNDEGKVMPPGDYIAEVRIGDQEFIRKRIIILR